MDAILLLSALSDIERALVGSIVRVAAAAGPHGLWLDLATSQGPEGLLLSADVVLPRVVRGAPSPAKVRPLPPLAGAARRTLPGTRLAAVARRGLDRVVRLDFEPALAPDSADTQSGAGGRLLLELFGSRPNLILTDAAGVILEAARRSGGTADRPCIPGASYAPLPPAPRPDPRLLGSVDAIAAVLEPYLSAGLRPAEALRQGLAGLSESWSHEIAARAIGSSARDLARTVTHCLDDIASHPPEPFVIFDEAGRPAGVAPVCLTHLPAARQQRAPTLYEALERVAGGRAAAGRQRELQRLLRRAGDRLRSRRTKLQVEAQEFARADLYQRMGEMLVANQGAVARGATEVVLPDHAAEPGATLRIPLDPTVNAGANAERLFRLARRGRRGTRQVAGRLAETEAALSQVESLAARAAGTDEPATLVRLQQNVAALLGPLGPRDRRALESLSVAPVGSRGVRPAAKPIVPRQLAGRRGSGLEPRRFLSSDGVPILVGRDNAGNDHVTLHLARSEDLWLHAEGWPGSHVVVRTAGRTGGIPKRTLVEAAKLAAYYSQGRSQGKVAVSYTLKKYVRKPRKAPPGLVTITGEKSILVTPDKALIAKLAQGIDD